MPAGLFPEDQLRGGLYQWRSLVDLIAGQHILAINPTFFDGLFPSIGSREPVVKINLSSSLP